MTDALTKAPPPESNRGLRDTYDTLYEAEVDELVMKQLELAHSRYAQALAFAIERAELPKLKSNLSEHALYLDGLRQDHLTGWRDKAKQAADRLADEEEEERAI